MNFNKILEIADGDQNFINLITKENIKLYEEFKGSYSIAMKNGDLPHLKFINHRTTSSIQLLEIFELGVKIKEGQNLISKKRQDQKLIDKNIEDVNQLCKKVINELRKKI
ncbi:hypothetical protein BH23BAC1_BH23BAC1_04710 [soil metagenome]